MHPNDLANHRARRDRQQRRGLATSLRLAYPQANPDQRADLERIVRAIQADELELTEARRQVAAIRTQQQRAA